MRTKTFAGLAIIALLAAGAAVLFWRDAPSPAVEQAAHAHPGQRQEHRSRGAIVPLPSDEPHAAAAFLTPPERRATVAGDALPRALDGVPTIRRQSPQLQAAFPTPLGLLGIDPLKSGGADELSPPEATQHVIVDGDTLPALAQEYLGDAGRAGDIYAANREVLASPQLLPIGAKIVIPAATDG